MVIKRNGAVIASGEINDTARPNENFRAVVPMDTNGADPYRAGAQNAGATFTVEVRFPSSTMLVSSLTAGQRTIGRPAGMVALDFTIGVDSDGDGIPDAWEWWQLTAMGIEPGDPRWSLTTLGNGDFDGDGLTDRQEYLAGTFAFLAEDSLRLALDAVEPDGTARLRAPLVTGKTYRVETSPDLKAWTPASVRLASPTAELKPTFTASETSEVTIYAPSPAESPRQLFHRVTLVR